jgi:hypothetical protein
MVIYFLLSPSAKAYIWGHELTHAFWGLLCGARVQNIRVAENGGSVQLSKSSLLITLSPYFFPFYTMLVLLIRLVCGWIWPGSVPEWVWLFLGGATWGFHCTFTVNSLLMHQPDMKEYIKCLSCGCIIQNPIYIQNKKNKERRQWIAVLIFLVVVIIFNISSREYSTSSKGNNRIENYGSNKGPSQTKAMAGVRVYLKRHYLKDPDSYEGISWEAFGIYNKDNNTYFALHKYRAKNSYGGYVVEEKLFVLDSDGNVIKVVDDMNEVINGY